MIMSMKNLFDQFVGSGGAQGGLNNLMNQVSGSSANTNKSSSSGFPGGLAGGLAAGGVVSLLMGSKKARKYAGKAATIGGAAMLGGAAFKLYKNWQQNNAQQTPISEPMPNTMASSSTDDYQLTLIKAMIAAAKADGHIDQDEQSKIFDAVETMALPADQKGLIFDMLNKPVTVMDIARGLSNDEQKTEVYMVSCMVGDIDHPAERKHLDELAMVLSLPDDLKRNIEAQVGQSLLE